MSDATVKFEILNMQQQSIVQSRKQTHTHTHTISRVPCLPSHQAQSNVVEGQMVARENIIPQLIACAMIKPRDKPGSWGPNLFN